MVQYDLLASGAFFALVLYTFFKRCRGGSIDRLPLPPGPKKLPLIGNLFDMPKGFEWITYHKWCKELGTAYFLQFSNMSFTTQCRLRYHPSEHGGNITDRLG
jgi:hypothetical protein